MRGVQMWLPRWLLLTAMLAFWAQTSLQTKPNIIFLLTDDQDRTANSLDYMPHLNKILREGGTEFTHYYVSTGLCCPSRATILRGQYCHNTKIWDNGVLNNDTFLSGGFQKWMNLSLETSTIATLFKAGGYETKLCGKYLNGYGDRNASHVPTGWDYWHGMTTMAYYGPHFSDNGKLVKTPKTTYQTDYIRDQALEFINNQRDQSKPFFLYLSPFAPHTPSQPAPRHAHLFNDTKAPRYPSYNPDDSIQSEKPSWIKTLPKLTKDQKDSIDNFYRNRLRALQAVDEMLQNITDALEKEGILDNTYIFYSSDNGQHLGDYRLPAGKRQAYDTDVNVPFLVRGPGVQAGVKNDQLVQSVDLLPTWMELAGTQGPSDPKQQDGKSMVPLLHGNSVGEFRTAAILEMFGGSSNMGPNYNKYPDFEKNRFWNNTYVAIRVTSNIPQVYDKTNFLFVLWCTGETELYNLTMDPHQIKNVASELTTQEMMGLQALVVKLSTCASSECYDMNSIINDVMINLEYRLKIGQYTSAQLPCHNPQDLPGNHYDNIQTFIDDSEYCYDNVEECSKQLFKFGFPFSDDDKIPKHVSDAWEVYKNIQNAN